MALAYGFGARVRRREDPRLITGSATYLDDVLVAGVCQIAFVRSYLAHAAIRSVDGSAARAADGVIAVLTGEDLAGKSFPQGGPKGAKLPQRLMLNSKNVCFAGDLIAAVVADTDAQARDAADLVEVELDPLPAVTEPVVASGDGLVIHEHIGTNVADRSTRIWGDVEGAFASPAHVVRLQLRNQRVAGIPIEPRGAIAAPNVWEPSITVWSATQVPHSLRDELATFLNLPQAAVRVI